MYFYENPFPHFSLLFPLEPVVKGHFILSFNAVRILLDFSSGGVVHCDADFGGVQLIWGAEQSRVRIEEWSWG